jgi:hypothetical protein
MQGRQGELPGQVVQGMADLVNAWGLWNARGSFRPKVSKTWLILPMNGDLEGKGNFRLTVSKAWLLFSHGGRQSELLTKVVKGMAALFTWRGRKGNCWQKMSKAWLLFSHGGEGKGNFWQKMSKAWLLFSRGGR